mmetsp:Transcript_16829/g.31885  ORF Transcript_16829/g.31885 Transcript_16829/m.31885 type:complete len:126 (-) Transcript_16829:181-558(-)
MLRFEGSNLFAELKLTPDQKSQAAMIRHHVRRQLISEQQIVNLHGFLYDQVDPRAKPQASHVQRIGAMATKSQHDNIWQTCVKEILNLLTPEQVGTFIFQSAQYDIFALDRAHFPVGLQQSGDRK